MSAINFPLLLKYKFPCIFLKQFETVIHTSNIETLIGPNRVKKLFKHFRREQGRHPEQRFELSLSGFIGGRRHLPSRIGGKFCT